MLSTFDWWYFLVFWGCYYPFKGIECLLFLDHCPGQSPNFIWIYPGSYNLHLVSNACYIGYCGAKIWALAQDLFGSKDTIRNSLLSYVDPILTKFVTIVMKINGLAPKCLIFHFSFPLIVSIDTKKSPPHTTPWSVFLLYYFQVTSLSEK